MSPDHWSKLTWDTVSAGGYDLLGPIGYLDRKRDRAYKQRVIDTPAIIPPQTFTHPTLATPTPTYLPQICLYNICLITIICYNYDFLYIDII